MRDANQWAGYIGFIVIWFMYALTVVSKIQKESEHEKSNSGNSAR
jgi:hypothetical protein